MGGEAVLRPQDSEQPPFGGKMLPSSSSRCLRDAAVSGCTGIRILGGVWTGGTRVRVLSTGSQTVCHSELAGSVSSMKDAQQCKQLSALRDLPAQFLQEFMSRSF